MARKNYFEMLGLEFDPPEQNERKIEKAIETWEKRVNSELSAANGEAKAVLLNELALKPDVVSLFKDNKRKNAEARELKEIKTGQLEKMIDIILSEQNGAPVVSIVTIHNVQSKLHLQQSTVESVYKQKGFEVLKPARSTLYRDAFLLDTTFSTLNKKLEDLRKLKSDKYPWTSKVDDLYDFICYFNGDSDNNKQDYHNKRTSVLHDLCQAWSVTYANNMDVIGHLLNDLFNMGTSLIFDSEANRKKYDQTLEREKLKDLFSLLSDAPEDFKRDRFFLKAVSI